MSTSILPLSPIPSDNAFLKHNPDEFNKSWEWLTNQYEQQRNSLEQYEQKEGANMQYILRQKSFLLALKRHLHAVRTQNIYLHVNLQIEFTKSANARDRSKYLAQLLALHGVDPNYFMSPFAREYANQLFELAKLTNSIRLPDAFVRFGNFPKSPFNMYTK